MSQNRIIELEHRILELERELRKWKNHKCPTMQDYKDEQEERDELAYCYEYGFDRD